MNTPLDNLEKETAHIALSVDEKLAMRRALGTFMALRPKKNKEQSFVMRKLNNALTLKPMPLFALLLTGALSVGGVSFAAENTAPGDILYPVKIHMNENMRGVLAVNTEAKAEWEAKRAERRLAEAEFLARRGELSEEKKAELANRFQIHTEKMKNRMSQLEERNESGKAAGIAVDVEAMIAAHEKILSAVAEGKPGMFFGLREQMHKEKISAEERRGRFEKDMQGEKGEKAAERRRVEAEKRINNTRSFLISLRSERGEEATKSANDRLIEAEGAVGEGNAQFTANNFQGAFASYLKAQKIAHEVAVHIKRSSYNDHRKHQDKEENHREVNSNRDDGNDNKDEGDNQSDGIRVDGSLEINL